MFYFRYIIKLGLLDNDLINQMINNKSYMLRVLLLEYYHQIEDIKPVIIKLYSDKSETVRKNIIKIIAEQSLNDYESILRILIFDT